MLVNPGGFKYDVELPVFKQVEKDFAVIFYTVFMRNMAPTLNNNYQTTT